MVVGTVPGSATAEKFGAIKTVDPNYFLGGFYLDTNGGTQTLSNYYEELSNSNTLTAMMANTAGTLKIIRRDNLISVTFFDTTPKTGIAAVGTFTALPARLIPTTLQFFPLHVEDNGANKIGLGMIDTSGVISIGIAGGTAASPAVLSGTGNARVYAQTVVYNRTA
jgi:hypothetical protein